jgi:hypothetical protein
MFARRCDAHHNERAVIVIPRRSADSIELDGVDLAIAAIMAHSRAVVLGRRPRAALYV